MHSSPNRVSLRTSETAAVDGIHYYFYLNCFVTFIFSIMESNLDYVDINIESFHMVKVIMKIKSEIYCLTCCRLKFHNLFIFI